MQTKLICRFARDQGSKENDRIANGRIVAIEGPISTSPLSPGNLAAYSAVSAHAEHPSI
jgi:hypothetical protein